MAHNSTVTYIFGMKLFSSKIVPRTGLNNRNSVQQVYLKKKKKKKIAVHVSCILLVSTIIARRVHLVTTQLW